MDKKAIEERKMEDPKKREVRQGFERAMEAKRKELLATTDEAAKKEIHEYINGATTMYSYYRMVYMK